MINFFKWCLSDGSPDWVYAGTWVIISIVAAALLGMTALLFATRPVFGLIILTLIISVFVYHAIQIYKNKGNK